jgi:hypothetical protein
MSLENLNNSTSEDLNFEGAEVVDQIEPDSDSEAEIEYESEIYEDTFAQDYSNFDDASFLEEELHPEERDVETIVINSEE